MSRPDPSRDSTWPDPEAPLEPGDSEPVSPFLDLRFQLGAQSLPIPEFTESNPISLQVAAAPRNQQPAFLPELAGIPLRAVAKLADWFLTGLLDVALLALWVWRMPWIERSAALSLALLLAVPAGWLTWALGCVLLNGRTLGKRLFGLAVVTEEWERLSPGRNFGRVWAETLSWGLLGTGYLFALFDPARRTLHDHLCGTRVIVRRSR